MPSETALGAAEAALGPGSCRDSPGSCRGGPGSCRGGPRSCRGAGPGSCRGGPGSCRGALRAAEAALAGAAGAALGAAGALPGRPGSCRGGLGAAADSLVFWKVARKLRWVCKGIRTGSGLEARPQAAPDGAREAATPTANAAGLQPTQDDGAEAPGGRHGHAARSGPRFAPLGFLLLAGYESDSS
jgi:hypothetical protein